MARSNQDRLTKGRNVRSSNNGSYRRGGSTRRMPHGGYHGPGQMQTSSTVSRQRTAVRNRVAPVRPTRRNNPETGNMRPPVGFTLQEYDYLVPAAAADCPQLGASFGYDAADVLGDFCPQTPAVRQLRGQLEKDMNSGGDTIMWYFLWCLCCMAGTCPSECSRCPKRQREERENRER